MRLVIRLALLPCAIAFASPTGAEGPSDVAASTIGADQQPTLAALKATGLERSRFNNVAIDNAAIDNVHRGTIVAEAEMRQANLSAFEATIKPLLERNCVHCHGADTTEGNIRIDNLDPDLLSGADIDWWTEIFAVVTNGEMPPPDEGQLHDDERQQLVTWLSSELQTASIVRRNSGGHSAFRRMTRYEYNYALQDLLGLPWSFADDLPPESKTEEGFENSSDLLHLSVSQLETYHQLARTALGRATVIGDCPPTRYWGVAMKEAAQREWSEQEQKINQLKEKLKDDPLKLAAELEKLQDNSRSSRDVAYYEDLVTHRTAPVEWAYYGAKYAFAPHDQPVVMPDDFDCVAVLPSGSRSRLIVELGEKLPDEGTMRVTVRASRANTQDDYYPSLQLMFGWQASNEGRALLRVSQADVPVTAGPDDPQIIQWDVPLGEIYPRNSVRKTSPLGATPSPSEYIRLVNSSASDSAIRIDYVQVAAPVYEQWPPQSHRQIFFDCEHAEDEQSRARETIRKFMSRAWRRPISDDEINTKLELFAAMRPQCSSFEEAVVEVLAAVLSSPQFLYLLPPSSGIAATSAEIESDSPQQRLDTHALASRLSFFLWCSIPDQELMELAGNGHLVDRDVLAAQVQRMLNDPRSARFAEHFVHQWLDLQLLEFQNFNQRQSGFDPLLKEAMLHEPVALFRQILREDASVLDFIHCDYAMVNERLAKHYGLPDVFGNHFRRVPLNDSFRRGGLLTQAGPLAMNSDWPDSHPLKRAIWLLESILADPPPPPPPAVPQIDLADPAIAKMTLKERIENHRNHAACLSCHIKIDPWGVAFENYDALGKWRDEIQGKPIDASSELINQQTLDGMEGLKRLLLDSRQDQFVQAMVSKLAAYAVGRPLTIADRADIDAITARVRQGGDGLRTMIEAIVSSELFRTQ